MIPAFLLTWDLVVADCQGQPMTVPEYRVLVFEARVIPGKFHVEQDGSSVPEMDMWGRYLTTAGPSLVIPSLPDLAVGEAVYIGEPRAVDAIGDLSPEEGC